MSTTTEGLCHYCDQSHIDGPTYDRTSRRLCTIFVSKEMHEANRSAYYNNKPQGVVDHERVSVAGD